MIENQLVSFAIKTHAGSFRDLSDEREWRSTTGLSEVQFQGLLPYFSSAYKALYGEEMQERKDRSSQESMFNAYEEWLFYLLFSLKAGLTYDVLGFIFGCDGSTAKRNQRRGLQILQKALVLAGVMPARHFEKVVDFEKWLAEDPVLVLDGTEQRSQRPANMDVQKDFYSGKKKPVP